MADVSFDEQPIIATDQVSETDPTQGTDPSKEALVTIDAGAPDQHRGAAARETTTPSFTVSWSGSDDAGGSGIASYDIYVSDNGGPYTPGSRAAIPRPRPPSPARMVTPTPSIAWPPIMSAIRRP